MSLARIRDDATAVGLLVMGQLNDQSDALILLGAAADFWRHLSGSPEGQDGRADPVDRYSTRVVLMIAERAGARAHFPFGGPPYEPFIDWAKRSNRAWASPTGMLVHDTAGLMISYRGALRLPKIIAKPDAPGENPCLTCDTTPCTSACPVGALSADTPYDVPACHGFLDTVPGRDCMKSGCAARRACPVSQRFARDPAQSAHHMRAFHPS